MAVRDPTTETLADDSRRFQDVVSNMHLVAITLNSKADLTYCNDYFLSVTGWSRSDVLGCNWFEQFVPPGNENVRGVFTSLLEDLPNGWHYENEIVCRSQEKVLIRWNNSALRDSAGKIIGVASIGEDITEHRLLESAMLEASARERRHLAAELHDGLGQTLYGARLLAQSAEAKAHKMDSVLETEIAQLSAILGASLDTCRHIAYGLSPLADTSGGIVQALRNLTKMPFDFRPQVDLVIVEGAPLLIDAVKVDHVYRLAQEALANALKHAASTRIRVRLDVQATHVTLTVEDDGIGLPQQAANSKHLGLKLMRYRARMIRATLAITRGNPHGTRVTLRCPR
jgi:PAS domain S-box-containing protein